MKKKILFFAPYGNWLVHHQVDAVLSYSLRLRGADVNIIVCDGIFINCPKAIVNTSTFKREICDACRKTSESFFGKFGLPLTKLSFLLTKSDFDECKDWAYKQNDQSCVGAIFENNEIGRWVKAGVHSFYLSGSLDLSDKKILKTYQNFLLNGALLVRALTKFFYQWKPNFVVSFQSILSYYRICFELARKRHIPVLVHERGLIDKSFNFFLNENQAESKGRVEVWNHWKKIPLSLKECNQVSQYYLDREAGKNYNLKSFYDFSDDAVDVKRALRIPSNKRIVALFTSADWENSMVSDFCKSPFNNQIDFINHHINIFTSRNDYLVIRHHPNIVQKTHMDKAFMKEMIKISSSLPKNIRMIMPNEKISSYALLWNADASIAYGSTIGIESFLRGVAAISYKKNVYSNFNIGYDFINYSTEQNCLDIINHTISKTNHIAIEHLRSIFRFSFLFYFRLSFFFKSFGIKNFYEPDLRFNKLEELTPGFDPQLDHICNYLLGQNDALYPMPDDHQKIPSDYEEKKFMEELLFDIQQTRQKIFNNPIKCDTCKIPISVICVIKEENFSDKEQTYLYNSIIHSRHEVYEILYETVQPSMLEISFIESISDLVNTANSDYIYIATENIQIDESFLSSSIDFFSKKKNYSYDALLTGAWIIENNILTDELFTNRKFINNYESLKQYFLHPAQLLSFFLWKKSTLLAFLSMIDKACSDFSSEIFAKTLSSNFIFKYKVPQITVHNPNQYQLNLNNEEELKSVITVVRIRQNGIREPHGTPLYKSLNISYKDSIEIKSHSELSFPYYSNTYDLYDELIASLNNAKSELIYFASDNYEVSPSFFSNAAEIMNNPKNINLFAFIPGVTINLNEYKNQDELFTSEKTTYTYDSLIKKFPFFQNPAYILSLCIFRKSSLLISLLKNKKSIKSFQQFSSLIFHLIFHNHKGFFFFKKNLTVNTPLNADSIMNKGIQCLKQKDQALKALNYFDEAIFLNENFKYLRLYKALAYLKMSKYWNVYIHVKEQLHDFPNNSNEKSLFNQIIIDTDSFIHNKTIQFEDISSSIDSVEGYLSKSNEVFLFNKVKSLNSDAQILEIGALYGLSSVSMGFACIGTDKHIYSMDTFLGNIRGGTKKKGNSFFDLWYRNVIRLGLKKYFTPLKGFSHELLLKFEDKPLFDFVFIDASHHYKDVLRDFELVYPLVNDNGWIAFHDVSPGWPGSWRVWRETAMHILNSHEYDSNLACGRKISGRKFEKPHPDAQFDFAQEWAQELEKSSPNISYAMKTIMSVKPFSENIINNVDAIIATMPVHCKNILREMLTLEASTDPFLHYFNALTFINEKKYEESKNSFLLARQLSSDLNLIIKERINKHLKRLNSFC